MKSAREDFELIKTQLTLMIKLADPYSDMSEAAWGRFFDLYYPAMLKYAQLFCVFSSAEDVVQQVLVKLVKILRAGNYRKIPGRTFRGYLKTLIRNEFIDWYRQEQVRGRGRIVSLTETEFPAVSGESVTAKMDVDWRCAIRKAAEEHVLMRMAISRIEREAYRGYVQEQRSAKDVARELGISVNYVYQAKKRVVKRISAVEALYDE